jgi:cystine transport system substrate-binding protein
MSHALRRRHFLGASALLLGGGLAAHAHAAEDLLDQIKARGTLRIGMEGTYPPFNYQDANGQLTGFEVDFAKALCAKLGVKPDIIPTKWDGILAALQSGRLDVVINQVTITPARQQTYDFTQPYTVSGIQIITRTGDQKKIDKPTDLAGKKVGVGLGTNYEQWLRKNVPQAQVETYDDDPTKLQDLRVGRIDAVLNDRLMAAYLVKQSGGQIVAAGAPFAKQEAGIALRKGNPKLLAALNTAIDELRKDGTLKQISEK